MGSTSIDQHLTAALAMLRAENWPATERHLKAAVAIDPDDPMAYNIQHHSLVRQGRLSSALELAQARKARIPTCRVARLNEIAVHSLNHQPTELKACVASVEADFSDDPVMMEDARLLGDICSGRLSDARTRMERIRLRRTPSLLDLPQLERGLDLASDRIGNIVSTNAAEFSRGHIDGQRLAEQAHLILLCGNPVKAYRYARQAQTMTATSANHAKEISVLAILSMIPVFWVGWFVIRTAYALRGGPVRRFLNPFACFTIQFIPALIVLKVGVASAWIWTLIVLFAAGNLAFSIYVVGSSGKWARWMDKRQSMPIHLPPDY